MMARQSVHRSSANIIRSLGTLLLDDGRWKTFTRQENARVGTQKFKPVHGWVVCKGRNSSPFCTPQYSNR